ncbi:hypothetical protein COJ85_27560 [Bacillus sp. AFS076308]|uniref:hypothetical protein n=1 Tax=unclassified Bacillus (in: firmicutes) TaxID=185979 RepID=UPI000BFAA061|nr:MULTISPECIES: hypothetical protein [unclassified Bacillus (in: firmicutes)]PFN83628.1 hypothetical protein COJ85_27560 [Bacillus sp. AFS076308]PGV48619.1 hypothetical protein COD92_25685 [Bacillus sp. AFS037270]
MMIILSDFYKVEAKAIENTGLKDEIEYHLMEYGCKPKKIYIQLFIEVMNDKYKPTKHTMILSV